MDNTPDCVPRPAKKGSATKSRDDPLAALLGRPHECADAAFARHLGQHAYHPRSSHHGDFLSSALLADLLHHYPPFANAAKKGRIVYELNCDMGLGAQQAWNVDLAIGPPPPDEVVAPEEDSPVRRAEPSELYAAVDSKGIMTEHGKARRNRQRDLTAFHAVVHTFYPRAIAGGLVAVNAAERFRSPLRGGGKVTTHRNVNRLVEETVKLFEGIPQAAASGGVGMDALGVFVVSYSNERGAKSELIRRPPAPPQSSPVNYSRFLSQFVAALDARFKF